MLAALIICALIASSVAVDPCAIESCPPSQIVQGFGSLSCACSFNSTSFGPNVTTLLNVTIQRDYALQGFNNAPVFVWAIATMPSANTTTAVASYVNISGDSQSLINQNVTAGSIAALSIKSDYAQSVQGSFKLEYIEANVTADNKTHVLSLDVTAVPCTPSNVNVNGLTITWDALMGAGVVVPKVVVAGTFAAADGNLTGNAFVAKEKCAVGAFTVIAQESINNQYCKVGTNATFMLTNPPTDITGLMITNTPNFTVTSNATANSTANFTLTIAPQWNASNGFACNSQIIYSAVVSIPATSEVLQAFAYSAGDVTVTDNVVVPKTVPTITKPSTSWDLNAVYQLTVFSSTTVGFSQQVSVPFTVPGYAPVTSTTAAPSSESGLSNTVIAGIAVGATVGVVALALIIYKCSSSRSGYSNIGGDSNA